MHIDDSVRTSCGLRADWTILCWPAFALGSLEGAAVVASLGQDPPMTDSDRPLEEPEDEPVEVPTASRSIPELIAFIMQGVQRLTTSPDAIPEEWAPLVSTLGRPTLRREHWTCSGRCFARSGVRQP